jgi:hypothetical protein
LYVEVGRRETLHAKYSRALDVCNVNGSDARGVEIFDNSIIAKFEDTGKFLLPLSI